MPHSDLHNAQTLTNADSQTRINELVGQLTDGFLRGSESRGDRDTRPFEELLTHLFPRADLFARATVAQKLARRADLPRRIIQMFLQDDVAVAEPIATHSPVLQAEDITALILRNDRILRGALLKRDDLSLMQKQALILNLPSLHATVKQTAEKTVAEAKPLIINIPLETAAQPAAEVRIVKAETPAAALPPPSTLSQTMIRAAVLRKSQDIAAIISKEINLPPVITQALLKDESGEALIAACHHLNVPEDASVQIATLLYPALTRTREQLTGLRKAYRAFSPQATSRIVDAWRALPQNRGATQHEAVHSGATVQRSAPAIAPAQTAEEKIVSNQ